MKQFLTLFKSKAKARMTLAKGASLVNDDLKVSYYCCAHPTPESAHAPREGPLISACPRPARTASSLAVSTFSNRKP